MIRVLVHDPDSHVASIIVEIISREGGIGVAESADNWPDLRKLISQEMRPVVVLGPNSSDVDLRNCMSAIHDYPGTAFVLVVDRIDALILHKAMRHGIRDVVDVENSATDLPEAVIRAHRIVESDVAAQKPPENSRQGKVVTVFGAKGGAGKSVVATNLAVLAAERGTPTALLDADVRFGDCAAFLRVRPEKTLHDIASVPGKFDDSVLERVLSDHPSGLRVLCAPSDPLQAQGLDASVITRAIEGLRHKHDLVVVDTAPSLDSVTLAAVEASDLVYLVTSLELPAVKDAKLCLAALDRLHLGIDKVRIVLNRADSNVGFPPEEVGKALKCRIAAELPSDVAVPRSVNNGVTVNTHAPRSKIAKALEKLADQANDELFPLDSQPATRSILSRAWRARTSES